MCCMYNLATPSELIASLQGMKIDAFEQSWSMIIRIVSFPKDSGSLVMKLSAIVWKGKASGAGVIGYTGGFDRFVFTLFIWQVVQPLMYSVMKSRMPGHQ